MASPLYCWRCDAIVPMLTEAEWVRMEPALVRALQAIQARRESEGLSLEDALKAPHWDDALRLFHRITGLDAVDPNAIWHHRLALYGPPCRACGKPLRTPRASLCAACGAART